MAARRTRPPVPRLPLVALGLTALVTLALVVAGFLIEERREWVAFQNAFRELELDRARSPEELRVANALRPQLKQIFVPELGTVDRCTSCHLAVDDPTYAGHRQPFSYHPDHDVHPFERFGCTVCHLGQGRATSTNAAHGNVPFWHEPMLPLEFIEASCGACHDPADNPAAPRLAAGLELFEDSGCRGCHRLDGWGGFIGPDLDKPPHGQPHDPDWLVRHFLVPSEVVPDTSMPAYGFTEEEARLLTAFVLSRRQPEVGGYYASRRIIESASRGARLFRQKGCLGCHSLLGRGGEIGPELDGVTTRRSESWLVAHFRDPQSTVPGTVMPRFEFTEADARSLVLFLRNPQATFRSSVFDISQATSELRGKMLFNRWGCRGCHGEGGAGGIVNRNAKTGEQVPSLIYVREAYTLDELINQIRRGQPHIDKLDPAGPDPPLYMPAFGDRLEESQMRDIAAYLFSLYPEGEELDW